MVHKGIEYGLMAAYAEGLNVLRNADAGTVERATDAETVPMSDPQFCQFSRFASRDLNHSANQTLSAMRMQFGAHAEKPAG